MSLIQYSWNWAFLYNDSSAISWLHYNFLRSMVAKCESNENGRFLAQLGLAKLRLNRRCCFLGKTKLFHGKITACLHSILLGASYMRRRANFLAFPKKFDFVWFLWTFAFNTQCFQFLWRPALQTVRPYAPLGAIRNDDNYRQVNGVPMGSKMAPNYACLFVAVFTSISWEYHKR